MPGWITFKPFRLVGITWLCVAGWTCMFVPFTPLALQRPWVIVWIAVSAGVLVVAVVGIMLMGKAIFIATQVAALGIQVFNGCLWWLMVDFHDLDKSLFWFGVMYYAICAYVVTCLLVASHGWVRFLWSGRAITE